MIRFAPRIHEKGQFPGYIRILVGCGYVLLFVAHKGTFVELRNSKKCAKPIHVHSWMQMFDFRRSKRRSYSRVSPSVSGLSGPFQKRRGHP